MQPKAGNTFFNASCVFIFMSVWEKLAWEAKIKFFVIFGIAVHICRQMKIRESKKTCFSCMSWHFSQSGIKFVCFWRHHVFVISLAFSFSTALWNVHKSVLHRPTWSWSCMKRGNFKTSNVFLNSVDSLQQFSTYSYGKTASQTENQWKKWPN